MWTLGTSIKMYFLRPVLIEIVFPYSGYPDGFFICNVFGGYFFREKERPSGSTSTDRISITLEIRRQLGQGPEPPFGEIFQNFRFICVHQEFGNLGGQPFAEATIWHTRAFVTPASAARSSYVAFGLSFRYSRNRKLVRTGLDGPRSLCNYRFQSLCVIALMGGKWRCSDLFA